MTFAELVERVAVRERVTNQDARRVMRRMVEIITRATLSGEKVLIPRLGVFERRTHKARRIVVPNGAVMWLPETETLKLRAAEAQRRTP
jgi:nucleoid DNA-binding protein